MHHKKLIFNFLLLISTELFAQFAPAAGQPGSTAIHKDSSIIIAWATGVELIRGYINISNPSQTHEGSNFASFGFPENALGPASDSEEHSVSLGDGGIATLTFDRPIKNGPGPDFCVFENAFSDTFLELAHVEVSSDGLRFVRFPSISLTQTQVQVGTFGNLDPTKIHNLAGKYRKGFGTPFDLQDLVDSSGIDLNNITHVRIIDVVGSLDTNFGSVDSQGNMINDPFPTPFYSGGFDLDAIGVINQGTLNTSSHPEWNIELFPNPSKDKVYLKHNDQTILNLSVFDSSGRRQDFHARQLDGQILIEHQLESGLYHVLIKTKHQTVIKNLKVL
jgi:hypothetical protein